VYLTVPPIFVRSTISIIKSIQRIPNGTELIVLPDWNSTTKFCSELQNRDIYIACRAVGIPEPQTDIFVNGNISEPFLQTENENEVVIISPPLSYGEVVMFECQASTMTNTSTITVNFTYTCKCIIITYTFMFVCTCVLTYKKRF